METNSVKLIALYLPQFHVIPENDEWWGKGFTEWTNVRQSAPLFKGHDQPRIPLDDNYYNLEDSVPMRWQAEIAKDHGVYGFCYYHYWFNGKKLLEKPLENMLLDPKVDIPFCLSWANEPWARTWDGRDTDVLMPQAYGNEEEWSNHFNYLLAFFKDERYIKVNNMPMMLIYRLSNIPRADDMLEYWNELAIKNGFSGIHLVETLNSRESKPFSKKTKAVMEFEPSYTLNHRYPLRHKLLDKIRGLYHKLELRKYSNVYNSSLKKANRIEQTYPGVFVGWDNSPRKGRRGLFVLGSNPDKFQDYLTRQIKCAKQLNSEFLFINAWNEWAEGAYLEPDMMNEFGYLKAIKASLSSQNKI